MDITVDRIVGDIVTCELPSKTMVSVGIETLPKGVKEGDILTKGEDGKFFINKDLKEEREDYIKSLADKLVERASKAKKIS